MLDRQPKLSLNHTNYFETLLLRQKNYIVLRNITLYYYYLPKDISNSKIYSSVTA